MPLFTSLTLTAALLWGCGPHPERTPHESPPDDTGTPSDPEWEPMLQLTSEGFVRVADLCSDGDWTTGESPVVAVGWFEGPTSFRGSTGDPVDLTSTDEDGFIAVYTSEGGALSVLQLGGAGDQRALLCGHGESFDGKGGLWVAGTFDGTMSVPGVEAELVATGNADLFLYKPLDDTPVLHHWAEGEVEALVENDHWYSGSAICAQFKGEITWHPFRGPSPWVITSVGGSDIVCDFGWGVPVLIAGPGQETLRGFVRTNWGSSTGTSESLHREGVVGGLSDGAVLVWGDLSDLNVAAEPSRGGLDAFLASYDTHGVPFLWTFGGEGDDVLHNLAIDSRGERSQKLVGTFGGGQEHATLDVGSGESIDSFGGTDLFFVNTDRSGTWAQEAVALGGAGEETLVTQVVSWDGGPGATVWTTDALVIGTFEDSLSLTGFPTLWACADPSTFFLAYENEPNFVPHWWSVACGMNVTHALGVEVVVRGLDVLRGVLVAGDYADGSATLKVGPIDVSLADPPVGGHAAVIAWCPYLDQLER